MAKMLQIFAVLCALAVLGIWFALGAHMGWSRNQIETKKVDPITEIAFSEFEDGFVPGIDFLGAGLIGSGVLFAAGFFLSKLKPKTS